MEKLDGTKRAAVKIGLLVSIVQKSDQQSGELTVGYVKRLLTNSAFHTHGIKVMLASGEVGRVQLIHAEED